MEHFFHVSGHGLKAAAFSLPALLPPFLTAYYHTRNYAHHLSKNVEIRFFILQFLRKKV